MADKWTISDRISNRVQSLPLHGGSAIGSVVIVNFVEDAVRDIENITGLSIDLTDITSGFHGPLTNLGAAYVMAYDQSVGIQYNAGRFNVDKTKDPRIGFFLQQAMNSMNFLGKRVEFDKTDPQV